MGSPRILAQIGTVPALDDWSRRRTDGPTPVRTARGRESRAATACAARAGGWAPALAASTGDETLARLHASRRCALVACAFGLPAAQTPPVGGRRARRHHDTVARNIGQHMSQTPAHRHDREPSRRGGCRRRLRRQERARRQHAAGHLHSFSINASLYRALRPGPRLQPISMLASVLVTRTSPPRTFVEQVRAHPGKYTMAVARWARRCTWPASA